MKTTIKLPGLSPAVSDIILHFGAVFLVAFGTQLVAGTTGTIHISSFLALLVSAAAAGITAVAHVVLGLIPTPKALPAGNKGISPLGIALKLKTAASQVTVSVLVTFFTIFGASLAGGAAGISSISALESLVMAAITAAVAGVVQMVVKLVPAPKIGVSS